LPFVCLSFHFIESFSPLYEEVFISLHLQLSFVLYRDWIHFVELFR
jgi:hypothetical protein